MVIRFSLLENFSFIILDVNLCIKEVSRAGVNALGYSKQELLGMNFARIIKDGRHLKTIQEKAIADFRGAILVCKNDDGSLVEKNFDISMKVDLEESEYLISFFEVSDHVKKASAYDFDYTTKLFAYSTFRRMVEYEFLRSNGKKAALFFFDLDNIKALNDTLGHMRADTIILNFASFLSRNFKAEIDLICRRGHQSDEFVVFAPGVGKEQAERILIRLQKQWVKEKKKKDFFGVDYSGGFAIFDPDKSGRDYGELEQKAEKMMYAEKKAKKKL